MLRTVLDESVVGIWNSRGIKHSRKSEVILQNACVIIAAAEVTGWLKRSIQVSLGSYPRTQIFALSEDIEAILVECSLLFMCNP